MNFLLTTPEWAVVGIGLVLILLDLWTAPQYKHLLYYAAVALLGLVTIAVFTLPNSEPQFAFGRMYVMDALALFFKKIFLLAALAVLVMARQEKRAETPASVEYSALVLFALAGMMWAASSNDFTMLFVSVELITVTFYVLISFQRERLDSLEAGVKYLILGAMASAFMVFGIAFIFGASGSLSFEQTAVYSQTPNLNPLFQLGLALLMIGLAFKIAAVPFQFWAPDVYQGAPTPTTAFLAVGSKAAGIVLLLRVLFQAAPGVLLHWQPLIIVASGATILYGNLCAIPQRNLKRLLGYSSIANAGYLLLGVAAMSVAGTSAVLYYLAGYLFTLMAAFTVICVVMSQIDTADIGSFVGLHRRSPLLAATLAMAMISLAGIPPLAGFFGKFLILKAVVAAALVNPMWMVLLIIALVGILISIYYYMRVVKAMYWDVPLEEAPPIRPSPVIRYALYASMAGMLYVGLMPDRIMEWTRQAALVLQQTP
jgi:NADH-quinone oxidoreductase subunit N